MTSIQRLIEVNKLVKEHGMAGAAQEMGVNYSTVERYMRAIETAEPTPARKPEKKSDAPVLIIPDLHAPYHHPDAIEFLQWVHETRGCRERVVSVGDMWDFHSMSFHKSEPEALGPEAEYEQIKAFSVEFSNAFPYGDVVLGNHCDIPKRKMVDAGIAPSMLKNPNDLYNLPDTWNIHPLYHVIEPDTWNVLVEHGCGSSGKYGCANTAKEKRCSYVQGHTHSNAAVIYSQNYRDTIFGMNVGCLVDSSSFAFKYSKHTTRKGNLGCGVVYSGEYAEFVPMSAYYGRK